MKKMLAFAAALIFAASVNAAYALGETVGYVEELLTAVNAPAATVSETTLGDVAADAARFCGGDIAVIPGGDLKANLRGGEVTSAQLAAVFPDGYRLAAAQVSLAELKELLEFCVSASVFTEADTLDAEASSFEFFPQISGFGFSYDISAPVGERVSGIVLDGGLAFGSGSDGGTVRLVTAERLLQLRGISGDGSVACTEYEALSAYLSSVGSVSVPELNRIDVKGDVNPGILGLLPRSVILVILAIFIVCVFTVKRRYIPGPGEACGIERNADGPP